LNGQH